MTTVEGRTQKEKKMGGKLCYSDSPRVVCLVIHELALRVFSKGRYNISIELNSPVIACPY